MRHQALNQAVIYARVSTNDQSCERQIKDLREYAEKCGYTVVGEFMEKASGMKNDREQRAAIIKLAQQRKISAVLVCEMSRWGRSLPDLMSTLQQLNGWGVSLVAMNGLTFDLSTPQGKLLAGILGSLSEFERDLIRERTLSGLANAVANGKTLGRRKGSEVKCARIKHRVLALKEEGLSVRAIARHVQASTNTVLKVLQQAKSAASVA